jgi:hypothetical protein
LNDTGHAKVYDEKSVENNANRVFLIPCLWYMVLIIKTDTL